MKKLSAIFAIVCATSAHAYTSEFQPYVGIDAGLNIADYAYQTDLEDIYYSGTLNAGARIGRNFGVELFFSHSSTNNLEYIDDFYAQNHEVYYMSFGFDIYGYYNVSHNFDFFTSFGVANYKIYNKHEYIDPFTDISDETSDNNVGTRIGIGLMYTFPYDNISGLIQYQYAPIGNELINNMSEFSVGFRYNF